MSNNQLLVVFSGICAILAVVLAVLNWPDLTPFSIAVVLGICAAGMGLYAQNAVFAPLRKTAKLLGVEAGGLKNVWEAAEAAVLERDTLRTEFKTCSQELASVRKRSEDAVQQANKASRMAEQSREDGMREAAGQLEDMVQKVTEASDKLSSLTSDVRDGADNQRDRMHETSVAMDEMNSAIAEVSRGAAEAANSVESAKEHMQESMEIVQRSREAISRVNGVAEQLKTEMADLGERAGSIDQVINVINDIADQTNLLALNAAIEAARAGEAGRGFAVVADEVRKLAEKTMVATKEVGSTIRAIQEAVRQNVDSMDEVVSLASEASNLAESSGESAKLILHHAEENAAKIGSIAAAAEQQSATSTQINRAVGEVREIAASIAEGVHSSSRAIDEMAGLSLELGDLIQDMKTNQSDRLVNWSNTLSVNVSEIDKQHKKLVEMLNALYKAMKDGKGDDVLGKLLNELVEYTVYHFDTEEKYFDKFGYPETAQHKREHQKLKSQVSDFVQKLKSGEAAITTDIMEFLKDWVINHIKKTDKRYGPFLRQNGLR